MKLENIENSKIFFYNDYRHDVIMNFLLNSFQSKSNKFMMEPTAFISLAETSLSHIRCLSHNRELSSTYNFIFITICCQISHYCIITIYYNIIQFSSYKKKQINRFFEIIFF